MPGRLQGNGGAAVGAESLQANGIACLDDALPAGRVGGGQAGQQVVDAPGLVRRREQGGVLEAKLLVLGADPVFRRRLAPGGDVVGQLLGGGDRRVVGVSGI